MKAQVQEKVEERKEQFKQTQDQVKAKVTQSAEQVKERPLPAGAIAGGVLAALVLLWLVRRK